MKQAKEQEERTDTIIGENGKLSIELKGAKFPLVIVESHHKYYIQRLKQERKETLSIIDNIYNMNGMEYENYTQR